MLRLGVDVGGTFTDFVVYDPDSKSYRVHKVSTTPGNPAEAILQGLTVSGVAAKDIGVFAHGTTVATNAVIQKRTAKVGLITTHGFIDILHFRRTNREDLYDIQWDPPEPLVPRRLRLGVHERINYAGEPLVMLDIDEVRASAARLVKEGCEAIAICFLNSYVNPAHELAAQEVIQGDFPDLYVTCSAELLPEWREFERTSTTVINCATGPLLRRYLDELSTELISRGYAGEVFVMLSNGGLSTSTVASAVAAQTLESGPAAGVIAQRVIAGNLGYMNLVGLDMGGTSTDVSLILNGEQRVTPHQEIEFGAVVALSSVDIKSIGAGGGSIATVDQGGGLSVGPRSAGASPGPACYGQGGTEPTVTDANVVLGRLSGGSLLAGHLQLDAQLAERAVRDRVAAPLGLSVVQAAAGIVQIAIHNMVNAVRLMTVEKGLDPRDFILFAYGGAGPMHAVGIAQELRMGHVLVPPHPGNTSALGLLMADVRHDFVKTVLQHSSRLEYGSIERTFLGMENQARQRLALEGIPEANMDIARAADLRYDGQTHDLTVAVPSQRFDRQVMQEVRLRFDEGHRREFWHSEPPEHAVELVNLRVTGFGRLEKLAIVERGVSPASDPPPIDERPVYFEGRGFVKTPIFAKDSLPTDVEFAGPAIVDQLDSTTVIYPDQIFQVDGFDNILITLGCAR